MMINGSIWGTLLSDLTLLLFFFTTNYPIRKDISQVINYKLIKTIESEPTFGKSSISNQSSLFKIRNIWQDINYNLTQSRKSKIGDICFSVVRFRLLHFSVQVPTWWWSKYSRGLIGTKGICIGFSDIVAPVGQYMVNLFVVLKTLECAPDDA